VAKDPKVKAAKRAAAAAAAEPQPWYLRHPLAKSAYKAQKKWRRALGDRVELAYYRFNVRRAHGRLHSRLAAADRAYDVYLREQLEETLRKKRLFGRVTFDVVPLVDMLASKYDFQSRSFPRSTSTKCARARSSLNVPSRSQITAFGNRFWSSGWMNPISSLPVMIFTYAVAPYEDWHRQAWAAALVLLMIVLATNIGARVLMRNQVKTI